MSKIIEIETSIDLADYIDECIEAVRDEGYYVFENEEQARFYFGEYSKLEKIKEIIAEARDNVLYKQDISQDYKELYEKLDKVLFYE